MSQTTRAVLEVRAAKDSEETPEAMVQFLAGLTGALKTNWWLDLTRTQPTITLEIASLRQAVYFVVTSSESVISLVRSQLIAQYRTSMVTPMDDYLPAWSGYGQRAIKQLVLKAPSYLPIRTYSSFSTTDPLVGVLGVLSKAPRDTAVIVQIVLAKASSSWSSSGRAAIKQGVGTDPEKFEAHPKKALIEEKIGSPAYWAGIRLFAAASTQEDAQMLVGQTAGAFGTFALAEGNTLGYPKKSDQYDLMQAFRNRSMKTVPRGQYLNLVELASIYHLPNNTMSSMKNLAWGKSIKGEPPENLPVDEEMTEEEKMQTTFFARTEYKNKMSNFGVKLPDRRRHFYILGKSGTGKSTLIANMALTDMNINQGIGVIDPHGDLCDILLDHIPDHRLKDVIYLDPSDLNNPFRLNPLEVKRPEHKELVASGIVAIFAKIFHYSWGPRLEYILRNTLMTLVEVPGATLVDVINILTNDDFRAQIVSKLERDNIVLINFWEKEFNEYPDKLKTEAIAPIMNKVGQFVGSPTIRRIIDHPTSTVDLEDIMNNGKILLLNLSQGKLGEDNATLLGAMFITQFQQAAMNRVNIPEEERRDFFLYVDEFQNFATTSFIKILSEARKYRLGLILANQYTAQLPEEIQAAIFGNVGSVASFVVGADDADRLMKEFGGLYTQDDLVSLDKFQIITKLAVDNRISGAFPAYTLPIPLAKNDNRQKVVESSRELYTKNVTRDLSQVVSKPLISPEEYVQKRQEERRGGQQDYRRNNWQGDRGGGRQQSQGRGGYQQDRRQDNRQGNRPFERREYDRPRQEYRQQSPQPFQPRYPDRSDQVKPVPKIADDHKLPEKLVQEKAVEKPFHPPKTLTPQALKPLAKPAEKEPAEHQPAPTFDDRPHTDYYQKETPKDVPTVVTKTASGKAEELGYKDIFG